MGDIFKYSDVLPQIQFYNDSTTFLNKILKTSESKNNTFTKQGLQGSNNGHCPVALVPCNGVIF